MAKTSYTFSTYADFETWLNSAPTNTVSDYYEVTFSFTPTYVNLQNAATLLRANTDKYVGFSDTTNVATFDASYARNLFSNCKTLISTYPIKTVTLDSTYYGCSNLSRIAANTFNSTVKNLYKTFQNCTSLVNLRSAVNNLDYIVSFEAAFISCTKFNPGTITAGNATTFKLAFQNCTAMTSLSLKSNKENITFNSAFDSCKNLTTVNLNSTSIGYADRMFGDCTNLTTVSGLNFSNCTNFNDTFINCSSLTGPITINTQVSSLGLLNTFSGCTSLTGVTISSSKSGGSNISLGSAFKNCSSLTNVTLTNATITGSLDSAFYKCTSMTSFPDISTSTATQMNNTFQGCSSMVTAPVLPLAVASLNQTFEGCSALENAPVIPNTVTTLVGTFKNCTLLTTPPDIPSSVTSLENTFEGSGLVNAPTIPGSVTTLTSAFSGCSSLVTVPNIPVTVTLLDNAFKDCISLNKIVQCYAHPDRITSHSNTFLNVPSTVTIYVPKTSLTSWQAITPSEWGLTTVNVFKEFPIVTKRWIRTA